MKVMMIFFGWVNLIVNSNHQTQCRTLIIQPNKTYHSNHINCYLLENEENDYSDINHIDQEIVQKSFIIPYQEKPIKILIINPLEYRKLFEKLFCYLYFNQKYIIRCISIESIYFGEKNSQIEKIKIITNIDSSEICDEIYEQEDLGFLITCQSNTTLQVYSISFKGDVNLLFQYDVFNQIQDRCQKQQILLPDFTIIFMYYQCSSWKILQYHDYKIIILLEANQGPFQTVQFVYDIQFCQSSENYFIYLIVENKYFHFIIDSSGHILHQYSMVSERIITKLIMIQSCSQIILITKYQEYYPQVEELLLQEISLQQTYLTSNIHYYLNLLFLQNNNQLTVIPHFQINKTYVIYNTSINFLQSYNLFYQIDQKNQIIQFYRYYKIHNYIKPKLKYIFILKKNNFTNLSLIECFKIQYQNVEEIKINKYQIHISIPCELNFFSELIYQEIVSIKKNSIQLINEGINNTVSIWNDEKFDHKCFDTSIMKKFEGKIKYRFIRKEQFFIFEDSLFIYFFDCQQNKILLKANITVSSVFESNEKFYIYEKTSNIFKIFQLMGDHINFHKLKIDGKIMEVQAFYNILVVKITNQKLPILLNMDKIKINYISKNLFQPGDILFYLEVGQAKFIQYKYLLAFEFLGTVKCFEFTGVLIVQIFKHLIGEYQILAIQKTTEQLFYYYFDQFDILPISNYTLTNYSILYPIKYLSSFQQFIVLLENNNSNYVAIFNVSYNKIILNEIIQTGDSFISYFNNSLLYNDANQDLRQKNFKKIFIAIRSQAVIQNKFLLYYQFQVNSMTLAEIYEFELLIQNDCKHLQSYTNKTQIKLKQGQNLCLKISDYFYGPVDSLLIKDGSQTHLKGPIQLIQRILDCSSQNFQYCFKEYHLLNENSKIEPNKFKVLIVDSLIILQQQKYDTLQFFYKIFWLKGNLYVLLKQQSDELELQLIILEQEVLIYISNLIVNFPKNLKNIELFKTGNILSINFNQTFFFISNLTINQIYLPDQVLEISQIENVTDLYIVVKVPFAFDQNMELIIYRIINFNDIKVIYTQIITQEMNALFSEALESIYQIQYIKFRQCIKRANLIFLNLLVIFKNYSFVTYLQINIEDQCIEKFEILQYIRNHGEYNNMNNDFLVQNQQQNPAAYVFYDLREDQKYKDYIFRTTHQIQIQILNTTHYIFINQSEYYLGKFGYEIEFGNSDQIIQNIIIEAQNQVSSIELQMQITVDINNSKFIHSIFIIQLLNLSFIGAYINRYKKKKNNVKQTQSLEYF